MQSDPPTGFSQRTPLANLTLVRNRRRLPHRLARSVRMLSFPISGCYTATTVESFIPTRPYPHSSIPLLDSVHWDTISRAVMRRYVTLLTIFSIRLMETWDGVYLGLSLGRGGGMRPRISVQKASIDFSLRLSCTHDRMCTGGHEAWQTPSSRSTGNGGDAAFLPDQKQPVTFRWIMYGRNGTGVAADS